MTATKVEQIAFAITSTISTDLFHDFAVFMQAGDGLDAISDVTDFESYLDTMTDEMIDEIDEVMERTDSDYSYYSQAMGEFSLVKSYISAKTWKAIQSSIESVFLAFQEQYPDDFRVKLPGELLERELLSIEHTVYSIGDDTDENSESNAEVLEEKLIEHFGISDITVTFDPHTTTTPGPCLYLLIWTKTTSICMKAKTTRRSALKQKFHTWTRSLMATIEGPPHQSR